MDEVEAVTTAPTRRKTHVALILDKSGSMGSMLTETISGFNEQLETLKQMQSDANEVAVTFTVFGTEVDIRCVGQPVEEVIELTTETYRPSGWTALYDAVGLTIIKLEDEAQAGPDDAFLVMVFSDGQENQSKEYRANTLASVIKRLEGTGKWTFSYMGSNQDLGALAQDLGVAVSNVCSYEATKSGSRSAFSAQRRATKRYFSARASGQSQCNFLYSDSDSIADAEDLTEDVKKDPTVT